MSKSDIPLATGHKIAVDSVSESGVVRYRQRVVIDRASDAGGLGIGGAELLAGLLTQDGAGAVSDMNVDGGAAAVVFLFEAAVDTIARIRSVTFEVVNTSGAYTLATFAGDVGALGTGLLLEVRDTDDTVLGDLLSGLTIQKAADWALAGGRLSAPLGSDGYLVEFDFGALVGEPLALSAGQKLALTVQDNLAALELFRGMVHGHAVPTVSA